MLRAAALPSPIWLCGGDRLALLPQRGKRLIDGGITVLPAQLADVVEEVLIEPLPPLADLDHQSRTLAIAHPIEVPNLILTLK